MGDDPDITFEGFPQSDACDRIAPSLAALAVGALDRDETVEVVRHIGRCPACRREVDDYRAIVDAVGLLPPLRQPTPDLRRRVLSSLGPSPSLLRNLWPWAAAVAALLIVGLLASTIVLWSDLREVRSEQQAAQERRERNANAPMLWFELAAVETSPSGVQGTLCAPEGGDVAWLIVQGLPSLPENHVYQAWLNEGDQRTNAGTFDVDEQGRGFLTIRLEQALDRFDAMGVTSEPTGGSQQPTGERLLVGALSQD